MKKLILLSAFLVLFSSFHFVFASGLTINEIMYDLSGADSTNSKSREWIEIYNSDVNSISIDASTWRIYDGSANRTINNQVNFSVPAGAYIIFAGNKDTFLVDHLGFSGTVYDTGITSLNNTGATLKILDQNGNVVDSVTYASTQGAAGDGNSLQKISGSWAGATPTPGAANGTASSSAGGLAVYTPSSNDNSSASSSNQTSNSTETKNKTSEQPKIKTKITGKTFAFAGIALDLEANAFGYSGEKLYSGKYFWNFGDGDSKEIRTVDSQKFTHIYFYPGEYTLTLEYYVNSYADTPDASDKILVKVIPADISISKVGDQSSQSDFFVELYNKTDYNVDLSRWTLLSSSKSWTMARNTILTPQQKMVISSKITNFSIEDKNTLKLMTPQGEIAFDYGAAQAIPKSPPQPHLTPLLKGEGEKSSFLPQGKAGDEVGFDAALVSASENLPASIMSSNAIPKSSNNSYMPALISLLFIGASGGAVYFIRQKKIIPRIGDDFKILDE